MMGRGRDRRSQPLHVRLDEGRLMGREREIRRQLRVRHQPRVHDGRAMGRETESRRQPSVNEGRVMGLEAVLRISKVRGDEFDLRLFDPSIYEFPPDSVPEKLLIADVNICPLVQSVCNLGGMTAFALYADGACCYGNGTAATRASVGVYGTQGAFYNRGYLLPLDLPQTYKVAKIYSAIAAIKVARSIVEVHRPHLRVCGCAPTVVLLMDSDDVVRTMTQYMRKWRRNGFITSRDRPVEYADAFDRLDEEVRLLLRQQRLIVRFWKIPRECVDGADRMAAEALSGSNVYDASDADFDDMCNEFKTSSLNDETLHAGFRGHPG